MTSNDYQASHISMGGQANKIKFGGKNRRNLAATQVSNSVERRPKQDFSNDLVSYYMPSPGGSMYKSQNRSYKSKMAETIDPTSVMGHQVLYDTKKMFRGEQDQRIKDMLSLGTNQMVQIRYHKHEGNVTLD